MKKSNVVEAAVAEWTLLILFVPEMKNSLQFFDEYHRMSDVTERDSFSVRGMNYCIGFFEKAKLPFSFEANSEHWQIIKKQNGFDKTELVAHDGL